MIKLQKEAKKTGKKVGAGPGGILTSFHDGMETLISSLSGFLGERLRTGAEVVSVDRQGSAYIISLADGTSTEAGAVVCATPAFSTSDMVQELDKNLSALLREIYYPSVSVVCLGYKREKIRNNLMGFGFLIPFKEGRKILGTLWDSSIFPNRAPEGYVLLRTILGGARRSDLALESQEKLITLVTDELRDIMGISVQPDFAKVYTHRRGIPQYFLGHDQKTEQIAEICNNHNGFYVTGNAYGGIGVNDCVENSYKLAQRILQEI